jgi:hypothetical protein
MEDILMQAAFYLKAWNKSVREDCIQAIRNLIGRSEKIFRDRIHCFKLSLNVQVVRRCQNQKKPSLIDVLCRKYIDRLPSRVPHLADVSKNKYIAGSEYAGRVVLSINEKD